MRAALLWIAAAALSGFTLRRYLGPLDEGVLMQAATRMAGGQWPWRDFSWAYGPGEPLAVMAAGKLLGPSLLWWRLLRVAADATIAVLVWALVREGRPRWALPAWAAAAVTTAQPTSANPTAPALAFALGAVVLAGRGRPAWAGAAAGGAAFWRPDMGAVAALAAALTLIAAERYGTGGPAGGVAGRGGEAGAPGRRGEAGERGGAWTASRGGGAGAAGRGGDGGVAGRGGAGGVAGRGGAGAAGRGGEAGAAGRGLVRRPGARAAATCLVVAALAAAALYAPFLIAAGPARVWNALVVQAGRDGAWWRLPFPAGYHGTLDSPAGLKDFAAWLAPYAALVVLVLAALARRPAGLIVLGLGATAYLLSRADEEHAQALLVVACALAASARPRLAGAAVLALLLAVGAANRASALVNPPDLAPVHVAGATHIRVPPRDAEALPRVVALVQRLVPPGQPIYVAPRRSDLVTFNDPLLHFLTRRPNVLHRDFLLQARPEEQNRIVAALERARPKAIVRWTAAASARAEPNERGRPSGSRALDDYLRRAYRLRARYGDYDVLVPSASIAFR